MGKQQGHLEDGPLDMEAGLCSNHQMEAFCLEEVGHHKTCLNQELRILWCIKSVNLSLLVRFNFEIQLAWKTRLKKY